MRKNEIKPGEQLNLAQINRIIKAGQAKQAAGNGGGTDGDTPTKSSDGMKVDDLRAALKASGIEIPADAKKADLQALLDATDQGDD